MPSIRDCVIQFSTPIKTATAKNATIPPEVPEMIVPKTILTIINKTRIIYGINFNLMTHPKLQLFINKTRIIYGIKIDIIF